MISLFSRKSTSLSSLHEIGVSMIGSLTINSSVPTSDNPIITSADAVPVAGSAATPVPVSDQLLGLLQDVTQLTTAVQVIAARTTIQQQPPGQPQLLSVAAQHRDDKHSTKPENNTTGQSSL